MPGKSVNKQATDVANDSGGNGRLLSPVALTHDPCQVTVAVKELELVNNISPRISWYKRIYMKTCRDD